MKINRKLIQEVRVLIHAGRLAEARQLAGHIKLLEAVFQIPKRMRPR